MQNYGDITKISGKNIEPVDVIIGGSPCFPAGTLVLTDQGYVEIENITVGMRVLTHMGRWREVTETGSKQGETMILKGNHYGLESTPNHPIYSAKQGKYYLRRENGKKTTRICLEDSRDWICAEDMKGRLWAVPNHVETLPISPPRYDNDQQKELPEFSEDFFYFIGRWLGDGWVRDGQRPHRSEGKTWGQIYLCDDVQKENELREIVSKVTDKYQIEYGRTDVKFSFCGQVFCRWLTENFGKYSYGKRLPAWAYGMKAEWRSALLRGMLESDGNKTRDGAWRISSVSKKLAEGIRLLGEIEGYSTTVRFYEPPKQHKIEGRIVNQRPIYVVALHKSVSKAHLSDEYHGWYKVRSVEKTNEVKEVYNLTVAEDNSYVADGIVVHNCQNLSIAGNRKGLAGEESQLFLEQVRLTKELRTLYGKPRYLVWENVKGAFSCNKGEDFRLVLESLCQIPDPSRTIPAYKKWTSSGCILGETYSVAWRLMDAQYWGVPQRRQRIALVADFDGLTAPDILFDYTEEDRSDKPPLVLEDGKWKTDSKWYQEHKTCNFSERPTTPIESHLHEILEMNPDSKYNLTPKACLGILRRAESRHKILPEILKKTLEYQAGLTQEMPCFCDSKCFGICSLYSNSMKSDNPYSGFYEADTSRTLDQNAGSPCCNQGGIIVLQGSMIGRNDKNGPAGSGLNEDVSFTLNTIDRHAVCAFHLTQDPIVMKDMTPCISSGSASGQAVVGVLCLNGQGGECMDVSQDKSAVLRAQEHGHQPAILCLTPWNIQGRRVYEKDSVWLALCVRPTKAVLALHPEVTGTLCASGAGTSRTAGQCNETDLCICVARPSCVLFKPLCMASGQANAEIMDNTAPTLTCHHEHPLLVTSEIENPQPSSDVDESESEGQKNKLYLRIVQCPFQKTASGKDVFGTLLANCGTKHWLGNQEAFSGDFFIISPRVVVRRLTPLECERLQGYPSGWTDIGPWTDNAGKFHKESSDTSRYKALGNSIALPQWRWVLERLSGAYEGTPTMGSLFDGIGGFPLIWSDINGADSVLWTSEIEKFPIAVTEKRFGKIADST